MPSIYLQPSDYANYGVPNATAGQVQQASTLIDGYLRRREGILWSPDAAGDPCYMTGLQPTLTLALNAAIAPGVGVSVAVTGPLLTLATGQALVLDTADSAATEAVRISSITGNIITFISVAYNHASGAVLSAGLMIDEERTMPPGRPITLLSRTPAMRIISGRGRYGYGRRGASNFVQMQEFNLLAAVGQFGGPPIWETFSPLNVGLTPETGEMWIPAGILLAYYTTIKVQYVAGFQETSLPQQIKQACAQLVSALILYPEMMGGNLQMLQAGTAKMQRFGASVFDDDVKRLLQPYMVKTL